MNVVYSYKALETSNKHYSIKKCALILDITIIIDHVEDHQHKKKCINNTKRKAFKNHNFSRSLQLPVERGKKMLENFPMNKKKGSKKIKVE